jgi:hypothetical protein
MSDGNFQREDVYNKVHFPFTFEGEVISSDQYVILMNIREEYEYETHFREYEQHN